MGSISRTWALILVVILAFSCVSLLTASQSEAQTPPTPTAPEFTLRYIDNSYDTAPIYGIDEYTGNNITIQAGQHIENRSIELTVINPPFTHFSDGNGNYINMYYNVSVKGHYGDTWGYYSCYHFVGEDTVRYFEASSAESTVLVFGLSGNHGSTVYGAYLGNIADGKVDFQVQTCYGFESVVKNPYANMPFQTHSAEILIRNITQTSDWSNVQTLSKSDTLDSQAVTPTAKVTLVSDDFLFSNQQVTNLILAIVVGVLAIAVVGLLLFIGTKIKRKQVN